MLSTVFAFLKLAEKSPPAIDYFYMPPHHQLVPDIALKKTHKDREFLLSVIGIHNLSSRVLQSIRIKLPFSPQYEPALEVSDMEAALTSKYHSQIHEVQIPKLDPNETIYVSIFLSDLECKDFSEPQVIVDKQLLSRGMRAVGYFKKRPREALQHLLATILPPVALITTAYVLYIISPLNPKTKAVQEAISGYRRCSPIAYEKSKVNESLLAKNKLDEQYLLDSNHVVVRKDLFDKDYVVICE
jgi:hypothetical protein